MGRCATGGTRSWPARGSRKKGLQKAFKAEIIAEIKTLIGKQTAEQIDFEALETAIRRSALQLAARLIEQWINSDVSDFTGPSLSCICGASAQYAGRRSKQIESVLGQLNLSRAYYYCTACKRGFFPRDSLLGLESTSLSPAVTRMVGLVGAMVSFQEGGELLKELAGVEVETKHVERTAEALGREIDKYERSCVESTNENEIPPTLYMGIDGTGVPMRSSELEGRPGKQSDGSAKTREVKLVTVWSAESRDSNGLPMRDEGSVTYSAAIESAATRDTDKHPSEFAQRVAREATRRAFQQASRKVALGDGAPWIWNIFGELFPDAIQIVDRFHAKQHLSEVAKVIWGPESHFAKEWAQQRHAELDSGELDTLLAALAIHAPYYEDVRRCVDYIQCNRHRMRYADFHNEQICTSTGVVEAGCKVAIGTRLKRAGMHWTVRGSNAIIALRCCKLSGRFEDFWESRSQGTLET